jgi:alpha-L-rhamnosidase
MVKVDGMMLQTGFVGTPYLLHALSNYGYKNLAYSLLLREEYPSWLYSVNKGATTIWEHWDGIMENGDFWSENMNSFNHYAYGAVADWMYEEMAGIKVVESHPGFEKVRIEPKANRRLDWVEASIETKYGTIRSKWEWVDDQVCYTVETPVSGEIILNNKKMYVKPGSYVLWG